MLIGSTSVLKRGVEWYQHSDGEAVTRLVSRFRGEAKALGLSGWFPFSSRILTAATLRAAGLERGPAALEPEGVRD